MSWFPDPGDEQDREDMAARLPPPTVASMLRDPDMVRRRIAAMTEQRFIVAQLFPPGSPPTWRQRLAGRVRWWRECLANWIAP